MKWRDLCGALRDLDLTPHTIADVVLWPVVVAREISLAVRSYMPRYEHDCSNCVYLGQYKESDLYFCPKDLLGPTIIARHGLAGDYASGIVFRDFDPALGEAFRRACERKLLRDHDYPKMVKCKGCDLNIIKQGTECSLCRSRTANQVEGQA